MTQLLSAKSSSNTKHTLYAYVCVCMRVCVHILLFRDNSATTLLEETGVHLLWRPITESTQSHDITASQAKQRWWLQAPFAAPIQGPAGPVRIMPPEHTRRNAAGLSATEAPALFKAKNVTWPKRRLFSIKI